MLLTLIPDEPNMQGLTTEVTNMLTARASNSLIDMLNHHKESVERFNNQLSSSLSSTPMSSAQVYNNYNPTTSLPISPAAYGADNGSVASISNSTQTSCEGTWTLLGPRLSYAPGTLNGPGAAPGTLHGPGAVHVMHARSRIACGGASGATFPNDTPPPGLPGTGSSGDGVSLDEGAGSLRVPCSGLTSPAPPRAGGPRSIGPGSVRLIR